MSFTAPSKTSDHQTTQHEHNGHLYDFSETSARGVPMTVCGSKFTLGCSVEDGGNDETYDFAIPDPTVDKDGQAMLSLKFQAVANEILKHVGMGKHTVEWKLDDINPYRNTDRAHGFSGQQLVEHTKHTLRGLLCADRNHTKTDDAPNLSEGFRYRLES